MSSPEDANIVTSSEEYQPPAKVPRLSTTNTASQTPKKVSKFGNFGEGFIFRETSHLRSFAKINPLRNGKITLSFSDVGKSCPDHGFLK